VSHVWRIIRPLHEKDKRAIFIKERLQGIKIYK
jgi:hypothetical protein